MSIGGLVLSSSFFWALSPRAFFGLLRYVCNDLAALLRTHLHLRRFFSPRTVFADLVTKKRRRRDSLSVQTAFLSGVNKPWTWRNRACQESRRVSGPPSHGKAPRRIGAFSLRHDSSRLLKGAVLRERLKSRRRRRQRCSSSGANSWLTENDG